MSIFDLCFLLAALASLVTFTTAGVCAIRGRGKKALRILSIYGACAAVYLTAGIAVSFLRPQLVLHPGDPWCFDDWCLTVQSVRQTPSSAGVLYRVDLRVFSRARRVSQRARGAWVYLIDERGRLYSPEPEPSATPLDVLLKPGESVVTWRVFRVAEDTRQLGLITGHGGPYCGTMSFLVIGESGCLFRKPSMIRIQ
jgi:hypothetical protein